MFYGITNHSLLSVLCGTETLFVSLPTHGHPTRLVIKSDIRGPLQRIDTKLISKMRNKVFYWILEDFFVWFGLDFVLVEKYSSSQHGVGQIWGILQKISEDSFTFDFEVKAISVQSRRSIHVLNFIANTKISLWDFFFQDRICPPGPGPGPVWGLGCSACLLCSDKCLPVGAIRQGPVSDQTTSRHQTEKLNLPRRRHRDTNCPTNWNSLNHRQEEKINIIA